MRFFEVDWEDPAERALFIEEADELLNALEQGALADEPSIDQLFRSAHTLKGSGGMVGLTEWVKTAHQLEDVLDTVRAGVRTFDGEARQTVLAAVDAFKAEIHGPATPSTTTEADQIWELRWDPACPMPGVRAYQAWQAVDAVFPGTASEPAAETLAEWSGRVSRLVLPPDSDPNAVRDVLQTVPELKAFAPRQASAENSPAPVPVREATIRVSADLVERILEGLGELLLGQAQLEHQLGETALRAETAALFVHMRRQTLDLQDTALRARMLPLDTLFRQYPRAVHDLGEKLHKTIRVEAQGGETELDRLMIDRLHEPLLHLLRNACDHGIEPPEVRRRTGKPQTGTIRLASYAAQGHVHILITDDGAGIDWERLRVQAVARQWMTREEAEQASEQRLAQVLFRPGVSTAETVTDLSGRGVGLDAVQAFLERIHGTVTVESALGEGTTFHLEVPMTMAIMTALLVEAGPWTIGLPILAVERIEVASAAEIATVLGQDAVPDVEAPLAVYPLAGLLDPDQPSGDPAFFVRVRDGRAHAALAVDRVLGQQEVVVKPVAVLAAVTPWMSGVALLGDGRVALMVDIRRLVPQGGADEVRAIDDGVLRVGSNQMELLVFRLSDGQLYGINVYKTREVMPTPAVTLVPGQHPWLAGFLRLRGHTVPTVSLHCALGLAEPAEVPLTVVTEFNQSIQAFGIDAVEGMVRVGWDQVEPLPEIFGSRSEARRLTGMIDHGELGPIQLIDFEQVLAEVCPPTYPEASLQGPPVVGKTVWLADDSAVARRQVEKALAPLGVVVKSFADGQTLWQAAASAQALPQVFVIDVEMPRLDGYTLADRLKHDAKTRGVPVVLHTSLSGHWHAERAARVDADAIVTKFIPERLAAAVYGLLCEQARETAKSPSEDVPKALIGAQRSRPSWSVPNRFREESEAWQSTGLDP